ncbi:MAG: hypothetical protein JWP99_1024 [Devosia sp.]|nr:hypothetical protein [Devosia sp.]
MNEAEADKCIAEYRALLKAWTMSMTGMNAGDPDAMHHKLDERQYVLAEIATAFPDKAYSVDLLVHARTRTWAGYEAERVPRSRGEKQKG